ncbi:hypothetical protein [Parasitella parasitica]|uniref:Tc1-like transposase DDE domain-containing protein n=1 Tax=Parasitella parasitica TaxID=35722 RepID=A0A0B7N3Y1_9FUNG|nr:hypothetical protein [Parasitella parasitica]
MEERYNVANEIVMSEPFVEQLIEHMDIDEDSAFTYGRLQMLANDTTVLQAPKDIETYAATETHEIDESIVPESENGSDPEIENKIDEGPLHFEGNTKSKQQVYKAYGSTAYEILKQWNNGDGTVIPKGCEKRTSKINGAVRANNVKLKQEHTDFLVELVDKNPCVTVDIAREELCRLFSDLETSASGLSKHMKEKVRLSLKTPHTYTMERDAPRTIKLRHQIISEWKAAGVVFQKNCVFIMRRRDSTLTKLEVELGLLKDSDVAKIAKGFPVPESKQRKAKTEEVPKTKVKKGTTAYHVVHFVRDAMDVLDKLDKKGFYIVMDNCRVHHSHYVVEPIKSRGYKPLFMPPYSPFLNPIEECWSKIKKHGKRNPLSALDSSTPRIQEACRSVSTKDCLGWIRHSESFWDRCLEEELSLV